MKFTLTFKTPDVFDCLLEQGFNVNDNPEINSVLDKFVNYDEYVTIVFDTDTQTASVKEL